MTIILKDQAINEVNALLRSLPISTIDVVEKVMDLLNDNIEKEKKK